MEKILQLLSSYLADRMLQIWSEDSMLDSCVRSFMIKYYNCHCDIQPRVRAVRILICEALNNLVFHRRRTIKKYQHSG